MDIPRHWRLRKQRYGLVGEVCDTAMQRSSHPGIFARHAVKKRKLCILSAVKARFTPTPRYLTPRQVSKKLPLTPWQ